MDWSQIASGLVGTVVGGLIAAFAGWGQSRSQRASALEEFNRQAAAEREREVRARADDKAIDLLALLAELAAHLRRSSTVLGLDLWDGSDRAEGREILHRIKANAYFLQEPVRKHVMLVPDVLERVEQLVHENWISGASQMVARRLVADAENVVGKYLRGEPVPSDYSIDGKMYAEALENIEERDEQDIENQIAAAEAHEEKHDV